MMRKRDTRQVWTLEQARMVRKLIRDQSWLPNDAAEYEAMDRLGETADDVIATEGGDEE